MWLTAVNKGMLRQNKRHRSSTTLLPRKPPPQYTHFFPKAQPEWLDNGGRGPFDKCHRVGRSEAKAKALQSKDLVNGF